MDEKEFKNNLIDDIKTIKQKTGDGSCEIFVDIMSHYLIDSEVISDFIPAFYKTSDDVSPKNRFRIDGYNYDELDSTLSLFVADFVSSDEERKITKTVICSNFKKLKNFLVESTEKNLCSHMEESTDCYDLASMLQNKYFKIKKYKFFLLTNAIYSAKSGIIEDGEYNGKIIEHHVFDINRIFKICSSEDGRQIITIDFCEYSDNGIQCLKINSADTSQYNCYLGVISGKMLADVYDKYGSKLLEGNVRSFLSTKVSVNKKIRNTILNNPKMFFAFNNGISATASDVVISEGQNNNECFIKKAKDFQIINGGQTTASISNARYKDKAILDDIYLQIKLIAINESTIEERDNLIHNISESSNSQNKVTAADFFASHPFHRRMEQISRTLFAPAVNGAQYETKWFYERARGQYLQEQIRLTQAEKKKFGLINPKDQLVKKTDFAKIQNIWRQLPHIVSKGSETNFSDFAKYINEEWEKHQNIFNEIYFKETIALYLIFKYLQNLISNQEWYRGGYRANIIYYTMSLLKLLIQKNYKNKSLNLILIWNNQSIPEELVEHLKNISKLVFDQITNNSRKQINVTQWCKKEECWKEIQKIKYTFSDSIESYLIDKTEEKEAVEEAIKRQKIDNSINIQTEIINKGSLFWKKLYEFVLKNKKFNDSLSISSLNIACNIPNKIPNTHQCKKIIQILKNSIEDGFDSNDINN